MLETIMLIGLGFCAAALLSFLLGPPLWNQAVRTTTRRIQSRSPLTMAEIQAERDQMRAEFAQTTRKLEVTIQELKKKNVDQSVDLAHYAEKSSVLETKLQEVEKELKDRESEHEEMRERVEPLQARIADQTSRAKDLAKELESIRAERDKLSASAREVALRNREAAKIIERKDREIDRLRKARAVGKSIPRRKRKKDPDYERLAEQIDRIQVRFEELRERFAEVRERGEQLRVAKANLDARRVIGHDEATRHRAEIADFESRRKTLSNEIKQLNDEFDAVQKELIERDASWQRENENPYVELLNGAGKIAGAMVLPIDKMNADFAVEEIATKAETDPKSTKPEAEPDETDDGSGSGPAAQDEADQTAAKTRLETGAARGGGHGASLAERIRALQDEVS